MLKQILEEVDSQLIRENWRVVCLVMSRYRSRQSSKLNRSRRHRSRLLRENPFCYYCGIELDMVTSTIDHVVPLSRGGTWERNNLVLACQGCNQDKSSIYPWPGGGMADEKSSRT